MPFLNIEGAPKITLATSSLPNPLSCADLRDLGPTLS